MGLEEERGIEEREGGWSGGGGEGGDGWGRRGRGIVGEEREG